MSDWMVIPEIENALIVFVDYPSETDNAAKEHVKKQLREAESVAGATPYLFYNPPDMGEEIHEWLAEFEERFAFAAQMPGNLGERMKFAFRRVLSRNVVKKAVIVGIGEMATTADITRAFQSLDKNEVVLKTSPNVPCDLLGVRGLYGWLMDEVEWDRRDVAVLAAQRAATQGLMAAII